MAKPRYTVMIRTLITPEQHAALVAAAMAAGTGASEVVRDALDTWLERIGPTEPRNDSESPEVVRE